MISGARRGQEICRREHRVHGVRILDMNETRTGHEQEKLLFVFCLCCFVVKFSLECRPLTQAVLTWDAARLCM